MPIRVALFCLLALAVVRPAVAGAPAAAVPKGTLAQPTARAGSTAVRIFTDHRGRVSRVDILQSAGPILDAFTRRYVIEHWHGPRDSSKVIAFDYRLVR